jgi:hypothetical protein
MSQVSETIPSTLQPRVDAALAWFNASVEAADEKFKVTGILDADDALGGSDELRLILCGGDRCEQRSFRVSGASDAWEVEFTDGVQTQQGDKPQAELDPPPGVRSGWLDKALSQHAFVVLLFYRGFW